MTDLDEDDLYGKAWSAVKKYWEQKHVMSEVEQRSFSQQSMLTPSSQYKIGYIEFLPTKQEYELVKENCVDEISTIFLRESSKKR